VACSGAVRLLFLCDEHKSRRDVPGREACRDVPKNGTEFVACRDGILEHNEMTTGSKPVRDESEHPLALVGFHGCEWDAGDDGVEGCCFVFQPGLGVLGDDGRSRESMPADIGKFGIQFDQRQLRRAREPAEDVFCDRPGSGTEFRHPIFRANVAGHELAEKRRAGCDGADFARSFDKFCDQ
jgi:hypothetical protein